MAEDRETISRAGLTWQEADASLVSPDFWEPPTMERLPPPQRQDSEVEFRWPAPEPTRPPMPALDRILPKVAMAAFLVAVLIGSAAFLLIVAG